MIKYKASAGFIPSIESVQIDRETEHTLWLTYDGSQVRKISERTRYFDSIDEARDFLLNGIESKISWHYDQIMRLESDMAEIRKIARKMRGKS